MRKAAILCVAICLLSVPSAPAESKLVAPTPPMGWNSWDSYGLTIDEKDFRANSEVLAGMKQFGWLYTVIDEGWYMQDPFAATTAQQKYLYDDHGLLLPVVERFPSAANNAGFKPLADWVHSLGLKFGIHIVRGIPKEVVERNLPIAGSKFLAPEAADREATCPWNDANYGVADNAAGQAYYDSMIKRYAEWGVDYIKVDCISDHPYRPTEIRQVAEAIRKAGRPMVLSLSPGPTNLKNAAEVSKYSQMWRITDDHWDVWMDTKKSGASEFPFGLKEEFDRIASWNKVNKPGSWPDPDMLPEGALRPHPGLGEARQSHYTRDEQQFEMVLWSISRSPLISGANLKELDDFTRSLMTNKELLDIDQNAVETKPVSTLPAGFEKARVWMANVDSGQKPKLYFAFFNLAENPTTLHFKWNDLGIRFSGKHSAVNVFGGEQSAPSEDMVVQLPAHGSALLRVQ